jgi:hypothetical protein
MEIYLAASWPERKRMRDIADHLGALGHTAASSWIWSESLTGMNAEDVAKDPDKAVAGCLRDIEDLERAARVAVFTDVPSSTGGFHVEFGYALCMEKPIDIIGPRPNVFYSLGFGWGVRDYATTADWFDQLKMEQTR